MDIDRLVNEYLKLIDDGLAKKYDPWELVIKLEDFIDSPAMAEELETINGKLAQLMIDDIYDITEPMEPGMDPTDFFLELENFKRKIIENR